MRYLRTGLSWADSFRPGAQRWFDRQMRALEPFDVTVTFCYTPESEASDRTTPALPGSRVRLPISAPHRSAGTCHSGGSRGEVLTG